MKKAIPVILIIAGCIVLFIGFLPEAKVASSVAIIGGADGPTSIFIAGKIGGNIIRDAIIGIALVGIGIFGLIKLKK